MAKERKLLQAETFSTAKLRARLQDIEQETFSMEAALRVARLRGIELNAKEEKELRKALEEESKKMSAVTNKPKVHKLGSGKQSVRYTELTKINDPRVSQRGPLLAARKVRKQVDPNWKDMRTMKPALSDLWDLKERYAQVCSPATADIDHNLMYGGIEMEAEDSELSAQREATCRHSWSSQTLYDAYLYKPDESDPDCGCNIRVHIRR